MNTPGTDSHPALLDSELPDGLPQLDACESFPYIEVSPYDDDGIVNAMLETYDFCYLLDQLKQKVHQSSKALDVELEDMAEDVSINFWLKLRKEPVANPRAYIAQMLHNRHLDSIRRIARPAYPLPLPLAENGEIQEGHIVLDFHEGTADPAEVVEQQIAITDLMNTLAREIATLPPRQKRAMVCFLVEQADDPLQLTKVLIDNQIQVETGWPSDEAERHLLQASLSTARRKIAKRMEIDATRSKLVKRKARRSNKSVQQAYDA
jgi:DNA-directed RNA polymerase specialized sigma24 family protein